LFVLKLAADYEYGSEQLLPNSKQNWYGRRNQVTCDKSSRQGLRIFRDFSDWVGEQKNSRLKPKHKAKFLRANKEEQP